MGGADKTRWGIFYLALAAGIMSAFHLGKAPPALPLMRPELGLGLVAAGWVVSTFNFLAMAIGMVVGLFADGIGRHRLLLLGLAALVAGGVLGSLADGAAVLLATRFVEGFGFVAVVVAAPSLIGEAASDRDRRLALGAWSTYMPTGIALSMVIAPFVIAPFGWRGLWLAVAALTAALLVLGVFVAGPRPARPAGSPETAWRNIRLTISRPGPWLLAGCFASYTLPWSALSVWLPTFVVEQGRGSLLGAAALTAVYVICNCIGNLSSAWAMHRGAARWVLIAVPSAVDALLAVGIFEDSLPDGVRYALCLAFSAVGGFITATVLAGGPTHAPTPRQLGTTNGLIVQGSNVGFFLGAPVVALVVQLGGGWHATLWVIVACSLAGLAMALALRRIERRLPRG